MALTNEHREAANRMPGTAGDSRGWLSGVDTSATLSFGGSSLSQPVNVSFRYDQAGNRVWVGEASVIAQTLFEVAVAYYVDARLSRVVLALDGRSDARERG